MMTSKPSRIKLLDNKGYSLVEMIIVIAIIAVMTGVATVTITLLNSAKAKEAAVTFTSELSDVSTKAKNQMVVLDDGSGTMVKYPSYSYCLKVYKDGSKTYIKKGYYNPDGTSEATKYIFVDSENKNNGRGISLSSKIEIKYMEPNGVEKKISTSAGSNSVTQVYIVFDRNGRCIEGNGDYNFYKTNGNLVSTVNLKKNGSYQTD